jgi:hypothetical protein
MNLLDHVSRIHWASVIVATVGSFVLGFLWHQPFLFGKHWAEENKENHSRRKQNLALTFGGTAVAHLLAFAVFSAVVSGTSAGQGLAVGLALSLAWVLPAMAGTYLFANRSVGLLAIDAGMYVVQFSAAGALLGAW